MADISPGREYHEQSDPDAFWKELEGLESEPAKQRWYLPLVVLFIVLSVPWYREAGSMGRVVFGMPVWIWTSLACAAAVSCLTAIAAIRFWKDRS